MQLQQITFTRFLAAISIVFLHFGLFTWPINSALLAPLGGDLIAAMSYFFILSGFVLVISVAKEGQLPDEIQNCLSNDYKLNRDVIVENVYMKPHANVYLASFMKVLSENKQNPWVQEQINKGMEEFFISHITCYKNHQRVPVHFIGSIAYHFEENLRKIAAGMQIRVGTIIKKPIFGLVNYHLKHHFTKKSI